jgi:hypothetical protein
MEWAVLTAKIKIKKRKRIFLLKNRMGRPRRPIHKICLNWEKKKPECGIM